MDGSDEERRHRLRYRRKRLRLSRERSERDDGRTASGLVNGASVFPDRRDPGAIRDAGHRMPLPQMSDQRLLLPPRKRNGLLVGFYEQDCKTWGMDGIDPNFVNALCPDDLDRVTDVLEGAFARMPALMEVGIHNGRKRPDYLHHRWGPPLVGPIPGKRNAFCIIGLRAAAGGRGRAWMVACTNRSYVAKPAMTPGALILVDSLGTRMWNLLR